LLAIEACFAVTSSEDANFFSFRDGLSVELGSYITIKVTINRDFDGFYWNFISILPVGSLHLTECVEYNIHITIVVVIVNVNTEMLSYCAIV